ncbi:hypothetical protein OQA88_13513 [Cercophora sp. LCS_1]
MSFLLSWLGLRFSQVPARPRLSCHQNLPSMDSVSVIDKEEVTMAQKLEAREQQAQAIAKGIVGEIVDTHTELMTLTTFEPGEKVNRLLGNLVRLCSATYDRKTVELVLSDPAVEDIIQSLRVICDTAEAALEGYWAKQIVEAAKDPSKSHPDRVLEHVKQFPYYKNYVELAKFEIHAIMAVANSIPQKIAFFGSGPMPLSSLCLLDWMKSADPSIGLTLDGRRDADRPIEVHNIDLDQQAIERSRNLCLALGPKGEGMHFFCDYAGSENQDLSTFDVVYMAALVGRSQELKEDIICKIAKQMKQGAFMVIRSARGMRVCLYPEVDITTKRMMEYLEPCIEAHPWGQVVNSVIVARRK